jgi:hypothetical protein
MCCGSKPGGERWSGNSEAHTWCETTIQYTELDEYNGKESSDYILRLHKNGTKLITTNALNEGVTAKGAFTYQPEENDEVSQALFRLRRHSAAFTS